MSCTVLWKPEFTTHHIVCNNAAFLQAASHMRTSPPNPRLLVALCMFANAICYADRTCLSVALLKISEEQGLSPSEQVALKW